MVTPFGTVVSVVGVETDELLASLAPLRNVQVMRLRDREAPAASAAIAAAHAIYVVHDADPLAHVASAWVEFFDDRATLGALEAEVEQAVGQFERGDAVMPDYYLLPDPEGIEGTWRHWWLGVLTRAAPSRVLPTPPTAAAVRAALRRLPASRPWPEPARWLPRLPYEVPDRLGLAAS